MGRRWSGWVGEWADLCVLEHGLLVPLLPRGV